MRLWAVIPRKPLQMGTETPYSVRRLKIVLLGPFEAADLREITQRWRIVLASHVWPIPAHPSPANFRALRKLRETTPLRQTIG
jgi:hypothetical protein